MTASNYSILHLSPDAIFLQDLDLGNKSITNDAANVTAAINDDHPNRRIFYKGTDALWAELVHNQGLFLRFAGIAPVTKKKYGDLFS